MTTITCAILSGKVCGMKTLAWFLATLASAPTVAPTAPRPALVLLAETGRAREGLPVYAIHPDPDSIGTTLSKGFAGRLLRLYQMQQVFLAEKGGPEPEPAYLLLSGNQGGFPRFGFFLEEEDKRGVGYVDLHRGSAVVGRFGALDQLFPHELAHVMMQQLAGEPTPSQFVQVHAVGVTTNPVIAFHEGFAEHLQVLVLDDPGADPRTRRAANDSETWRRTRRRLEAYRRELSARWAPATRMRMTFPLWFSNADQAMRYHAVKANRFAYEPSIPQRLIDQKRLQHAYLLTNILPGTPGSKPKSAARMLACEGVVAALFHTWATSGSLGERYENEQFYAQFGVSRRDIDALDNVYLKILVALFRHKPRDTAELITGYRATFPRDAAALDSVVTTTLLGQTLPSTEPLWIVNPAFAVGTSLFDQFKAAPRTHTFDLNAASIVDLIAVPGMDVATARAIVSNGPYASFRDLRERVAMNADVGGRLQGMLSNGTHRSQAEMEGRLTGVLRRVLLSYVWRALGALAAASLCAAFLYRRLRRCSWPRAGFAALSASLLGLFAVWIVDAPGGWMAVVVPTILLGLPSALWRAARARAWSKVFPTLLVWAITCLPAALLSQPLF